MSDQEQEPVVKPKKTIRGKRGIAKLKEIQASTKPKEPISQESGGLYSGCISRLFNKIDTHGLKAVVPDIELEEEEELKSDCPVPVKQIAVKENRLVISDDENGDVSCNEVVRSEENVNDNCPAPPSPPPAPAGLRNLKKKKIIRRGQRNKKILSAVDELTNSVTEAQRQLKAGALTSPDGDASLLESDDSLTVRVEIRGCIHRYILEASSPFCHIITQIAGERHVPEKHVMLVHKDKTLRSSDTPASVKLETADIIVCHILENLEDSMNDSSSQHDDPNLIELVVQSRGSRNKKLIKAHIHQPLSMLIEEYAKLVEKDPACLLFRFDGDIVKPNETAEILDMEEGDILDVQEIDVQVIH